MAFCLAIIYLEERSKFKAKLGFWGFYFVGLCSKNIYSKFDLNKYISYI